MTRIIPSSPSREKNERESFSFWEKPSGNGINFMPQNRDMKRDDLSVARMELIPIGLSRGTFVFTKSTTYVIIFQVSMLNYFFQKATLVGLQISAVFLFHCLATLDSHCLHQMPVLDVKRNKD